MAAAEVVDPRLLSTIKASIREDDAIMKSSLQSIKEWLQQTPHLPDTWDEAGLLSFLRGCNYSLEKTKKKLDLYFSVRSSCPEFFSNRDITRPEFKLIMEFALGMKLPGLTPEGYRIAVVAGKDKTVTSPSAEDAFKVVFMLLDVLLMDTTPFAGDVVILDAGVVTPTHFAKVTPPMVKKFLTIAIDAYPIKLKQVHVVNAHPFIQVIFTWVKPLIKDKIINRVTFHEKGFASLHKCIPKEMLPTEYGGDAGPMQKYHDIWHQKLIEFIPWFREQEHIKGDLRKRPRKSMTYNELFGLSGSFRRLSID